VQGRITFRDSQTDKPHRQCGRGVPLWMEMGSWVHSWLSSLAETLARAMTIPLSEKWRDLHRQLRILRSTCTDSTVHWTLCRSDGMKCARPRSGEAPQVPPQISSYLHHAMRFRPSSLSWLTAKETDIRIHSHCATWIQTSGSSC
jgi:hypothetical protein